MHSFAQNRRGILSMMAAMAIFTTSDTMMKIVREAAPPGEVVFIRGAFAILFSLVLLFGLGQIRRLPDTLSGWVALRAGLEAVVAICFVIALGHLPLADLTAIGQSAPILIAVACAVSGLEPMGWRRWLAVLVGFGGVLLVVRPTGSHFDAYSFVALLSAFFVAGRDLVTRSIPRAIPTAAILTATSTAVCLSGLGMITVENWVHLAPVQWLYLIGAGAAVMLGQFFVITAFRDVDVSVVSPFRYSVIIWAVLAGAIVFGELPDAMTITGAALVIGSGIYTIHRERIRARMEPATASAAANCEPAP
ncbi:membrane protein [Alsobacter metallidurans]|uniref:Membrane protein n=1 Tax=Alsobacter metallidurans TaxID=340221 RepID=A0A917I5G3_9HYPH|nr:DMT family transporter [Alsobacter metallidurans]GGH14343.1 membrane protein [Alsobacter metallidurans]